MTHNAWEHGDRLTIHNASKEQLKFMVRGRDRCIKDMTKEIETLKSENKILLDAAAKWAGMVMELQNRLEKEKG
ncbi:hypothetical protein D5272_01720 [bacterium D16-76]|nr:hypothetical protein [bacterium D16-76]